MQNIKYGVFLARFQPLHNAHLEIINRALEENDKLVIILSSANKKRTLRNPFSSAERIDMLSNALTKEQKDRVIIFELPDWSTEDDVDDNKLWGRYLYYNIVSRTQNKYFKFYYSDNPKIMTNWFEGTEIEKYIKYSFQERDKMFKGLSATKIREAFRDNDVEYVKKYCPKSISHDFNYYRGVWLDVLENPKIDFSM